MAKKDKKEKKGKKKIVGRIFLVLGILVSMAAGSILATAQYRIDGSLGLINFDQKDSLDTVDISKYDTVSDSAIINVLLVGGDKDPDEQDKDDVSRRSDSMMIATLDMKHKKLKVTSLMRDMYVEIPGHGSHKLNAAHRFGGIKLLYETIASNFGIKMNGYAEVNFDAFVDVISAVGGVEATLTESEAVNLNDTNYIKRKKFRNVKVGKQVLNGYQALGYCRIRHGKWKNGHYPAVLTASGKGDDYGRAERQRLVMQALLKKIKSMSLNKWMELIDIIMPNIKTDLTKDDIYSYMLAVIQMGTTELNQYSLPIDGGYTSQTISGEDCLVPDIPKNKSALYDFIYKK
ncbi:MAG: LCP family protein [Roseburia sp.]|nr:LCP family protein [Roseburia sp.]